MFTRQTDRIGPRFVPEEMIHSRQLKLLLTEIGRIKADAVTHPRDRERFLTTFVISSADARTAKRYCDLYETGFVRVILGSY